MPDQPVSANSPPERKPVCFVISPFGERDSATRKRADQFRRHVVERAIGNHYEVRRADDFGEPGVITSHMITQILNAEMAVADLSGHNANVFYEVGIRHMAGKPVVHLIEDGEVIPFDMLTQNTIRFTLQDPDVLETAVAELRRQVEAVRTNPNAFTNPVQETISLDQARASADAGDRLTAQLIDRFDALGRQVTRIAQTVRHLDRRDANLSERPPRRSLPLDLNAVPQELAAVAFEYAYLHGKPQLTPEEATRLRLLERQLAIWGFLQNEDMSAIQTESGAE